MTKESVFVLEKKVIPSATCWIGVERNRVEYYYGLRQKADKWMHAQIANYVQSYIDCDNKKPIRILDWGAGEGALSKRLHDAGMIVVSVDMDESNFNAVGPKFYKLDFNDQSAVDRFIDENQGSFDLIIATEVIEHIHDAWFFMSGLKRLCDDQTHVIVTTPNVSNWWGRVWFLFTGELWGFSQDGWRNPGHILPITDVQFDGITSDVGFRIVGKASCGFLPIFWLYNIKRFTLSLAFFPLRLLQRGRLEGWATLYHLKIK